MAVYDIPIKLSAKNFCSFKYIEVTSIYILFQIQRTSKTKSVWFQNKLLLLLNTIQPFPNTTIIEMMYYFFLKKIAKISKFQRKNYSKKFKKDNYLWHSLLSISLWILHNTSSSDQIMNPNIPFMRTEHADTTTLNSIKC